MVLAILQARTSSSRLPGKVLEPVAGAPLILRALERISWARTIDTLVLATSTEESDNALAEIVSGAGYTVHRGPLDDVLTRFLGVLDVYDDNTVVRLTGDNVLCDPVVIDRVVEEHLAAGADYTSNVIERSFPRGLDVEVFRADALRAVDALAVEAEEREHVTIGIYRRPESFKLHSVTQPTDRSALRWTVDFPEDLAFARAVYDELFEDTPSFGQEDVATLLDRRPELIRRESDQA